MPKCTPDTSKSIKTETEYKILRMRNVAQGDPAHLQAWRRHPNLNPDPVRCEDWVVTLVLRVFMIGGEQNHDFDPKLILSSRKPIDMIFRSRARYLKTSIRKSLLPTGTNQRANQPADLRKQGADARGGAIRSTIAQSLPPCKNGKLVPLGEPPALQCSDL